MKTITVERAPGEAAQIAFDKVSKRVRDLFARGYSVKQPGRSGMRPGVFALETLPNSGGWKITYCPLPHEAIAA